MNNGVFENFEAECSLLGSILQEPSLLDELNLKYTDFKDSRNRYVSKAIEGLVEAKAPIDLITITTWLGERNLLDKIDGVSYISDLANSVPSTANVKYYEKLVKSCAKKRLIQRTLEKMSSKLSEVENEEELDSLIGKGFEVIQNAGESKLNGFTHIKEVMIDVYDNAEEDKGDVIGTPTGFYDLDRMLGGMRGGDFIVIGARPSMGKTAFMLNVANGAAKSGDLVPIFSLEMKLLSLGQRMVSSEGRIDSRRLKIGGKNLTGDEWTKLTMAIGELCSLDVLLNDTSAVTINDIKKELTKLRKENPNRRITCLIDYLQLITGDPKFKGNRQAEISDISRQLKIIAQDLDIVIVGLSQLSRSVEQRQDKRPMLSDLRESGSIEQDADIVMFLYRDDYYDKESENKNLLECIVAKQRDGAVGTVQLAFVKEYGAIVNLDRGVQN
ncbi:DNA helicase [Bacillus phage Silence]|nr:DNA helicase [Bacillus phage Silence]